MDEAGKLWKIYQGDSGRIALEISDCRDFYRLEFLDKGVESAEEQEKMRQQEIEKVRSLILPLHRSLKNTFSKFPKELKQYHEKEEEARENLMQYWVPFEDIQAIDRKGQDFLDIHFQARNEVLKLKEELGKVPEENEKTMTVRDFIENYEGKIDVRNDCVGGTIPFTSNNGKYRFTSEGLKEFEDVLDFKMTVKENEAVIHIPRQEDKLKEFDTLEHVGQLFVALSERTSDFDKWFGLDNFLGREGKEMQENKSMEFDFADMAKRMKEQAAQPHDFVLGHIYECTVAPENDYDEFWGAGNKYICENNQYDPQNRPVLRVLGGLRGIDINFLSSDNFKDITLEVEQRKNEKQNGNTVVSNTNLREATRMENEGKKPERKTENLLTPKQMRPREFEHSVVAKGYMFNVKAFAPRVNEATQETTHGYSFSISSKPLTPEGKAPSDAHVTMCNCVSHVPADLEAQTGKQVLVTGQMFERDRKDKDGNATGERYGVLFSRSILPAIEKEANGKTIIGGDQEHPIIAAADMVQNEFYRAANIHLIGFVFESQYNQFNREVKDTEGTVLGYAHNVSLSTREYKDGKAVKDEKGDYKYKRMSMQFVTKEPMGSEARAALISTKEKQNRLSIGCAIQMYDYQENLKDNKGNIVKDEQGNNMKGEWKSTEVVKPIQIYKFRDLTKKEPEAQAARPLNMEMGR